ncbi:GDSL-type esterase/lipase family protein, partial [Virgibacillus sp. DJP39]|uniref:GDSL-type esterase/lipase family protein n=1 Tax=Virgibacillus sp. DJP39 TaxID=3409790 RepID=UPI003BB7005E
MTSKILKALAFVLILSVIFSSTSNAKSNNGKESLVALGDSIPFGYNLGQTNHNPAKVAYPYLIGDDGDLRVRNLGVPGWQTDQLLTALKTDQKYRQALKHADYVVLTIGNNDLLEILESASLESGQNPGLFQKLLQQKLLTSKVFLNIGEIIAETRTLTDAPIVMYNVYNPFQLGDPLHGVASGILPLINGKITG